MARPGEYARGPSPWVPATILGIIFLIVSTPYRMAPDPAAIAYQPARKPTIFPPALLWIPVICFLLMQFFGGSYRAYGYDRLGRPVMKAGSYGGGVAAGGYGDSMYAAGTPYNNYYRYNGPYDRGVMSSFMDYGGHWLLILLGIALFSMVGSGTAPAAAAIPRPSLGFPWSLFAPRPQIVIPMM